MSKKYDVDVAGVLIGYLGLFLHLKPLAKFIDYHLVAKDIIVLPKSVTPSRISSNLKGAIRFAKSVDKADLETLDGVAAMGKQKRFIMPPWVITFILIIMVFTN
jgi:glycerol 2-dehydrogenase (NADP+)